MKEYRFGDYYFRVYKKEKYPLDEDEFVSECPNTKRPEQAISIRGKDIVGARGQWLFCHMIDLITRFPYNIVVQEVK